MTLITVEGTALPEQMYAVVLRKPFHLEYTKIPVWPIESYEDPKIVLLKVNVCGVCGSDFRYYQGENPWAQHTTGKHIANPPNIVLGHEYVGTVYAVLAEDNREWLGKRVVPICSQICGRCQMCQTNRAHLCENTIHIGHGQGWGTRAYYPGAYAEYAPAWIQGCYEIPSHVSSEEAAMMDVLAVSTHAFDRADHKVDLPLLILGAGAIGNGIGQAARNQGVAEENIILIDNSPISIQVASETGFQNMIDSSDKDRGALTQLVRAVTNNRNVFSVFDTIGTDFSFTLGMNLLDKGGTFVNLAVHDQNLIDFNQMQLSSERNLTTSSNFSLSAYNRTWNWLCRGRYNLTPWFSKISLAEVPKFFTEKIKNKKQREYFKLVITG
ncbi:MAG: hypothetical protein EU536_04980 [Promethearchaeota archaeon]|nr:MAG: hypothetical protein EU536_04980 [Candidatus Lokiarchaeota archaeon]